MARNIGINGALSCILLACGILYSILMGVMYRVLVTALRTTLSDDTNIDDFAAVTEAPYWTVGLTYIIPGVTGIIASYVNRKGVYLIQMLFCICALVTMATFFLGGIAALSAKSLFDARTCSSFNEDELIYLGNMGFTCEDLNSVAGMAIGVAIMVIVGWVCALFVAVLAGKLLCSKEDQAKEELKYSIHQDETGGIPHNRAYVLQPVTHAQPRYGSQPGYVTYVYN